MFEIDHLCPIHNVPMHKATVSQPTTAYVFKWVCPDCEAAKIAVKRLEDDERHWLRVYAGQALQGILSNPSVDVLRTAPDSTFSKDAVEYAKALLDDIKRVEANND